VLPLFRAAAAEVESLLLEMHDADWSRDAPSTADSGGGADGVLQASRYIRRLEAFLRRFQADYLGRFAPPPSPAAASFAALLCQRLAARALCFFARHGALLRPLGEAGKLQLAKARLRFRLHTSAACRLHVAVCLLLQM
jgi:conserved oligomeric Golgi complex subunit 5